MNMYARNLQKKEPLKAAILLLILSLCFGGVYAKISQNLLRVGIESFSSRYFVTIQNMAIDYWDLFQYILWSGMKSFFLIWIFSLTIFGLPYLGWMIVSKGFQLGYLLTALFLNYNFKGVLLFFIYFFPQGLIFLPVSLICLKYCYQLTMEMNHGQATPSLHNITILKKYSRLIIILLIALTIGALMETFFGSFCLRKFLRFF